MAKISEIESALRAKVQTLADAFMSTVSSDQYDVTSIKIQIFGKTSESYGVVIASTQLDIVTPNANINARARELMEEFILNAKNAEIATPAQTFSVVNIQFHGFKPGQNYKFYSLVDTYPNQN